MKLRPNDTAHINEWINAFGCQVVRLNSPQDEGVVVLNDHDIEGNYPHLLDEGTMQGFNWKANLILR